MTKPTYLHVILALTIGLIFGLSVAAGAIAPCIPVTPPKYCTQGIVPSPCYTPLPTLRLKVTVTKTVK